MTRASQFWFTLWIEETGLKLLGQTGPPTSRVWVSIVSIDIDMPKVKSQIMSTSWTCLVPFSWTEDGNIASWMSLDDPSLVSCRAWANGCCVECTLCNVWKEPVFVTEHWSRSAFSPKQCETLLEQIQDRKAFQKLSKVVDKMEITRPEYSETWPEINNCKDGSPASEGNLKTSNIRSSWRRRQLGTSLLTLVQHHGKWPGWLGKARGFRRFFFVTSRHPVLNVAEAAAANTAMVD